MRTCATVLTSKPKFIIQYPSLGCELSAFASPSSNDHQPVTREAAPGTTAGAQNLPRKILAVVEGHQIEVGSTGAGRGLFLRPNPGPTSPFRLAHSWRVREMWSSGRPAIPFWTVVAGIRFAGSLSCVSSAYRIGFKLSLHRRFLSANLMLVFACCYSRICGRLVAGGYVTAGGRRPCHALFLLATCFSLPRNTGWTGQGLSQYVDGDRWPLPPTTSSSN